jgi:hypothetical protein
MFPSSTVVLALMLGSASICSLLRWRSTGPGHVGGDGGGGGGGGGRAWRMCCGEGGRERSGQGGREEGACVQVWWRVGRLDGGWGTNEASARRQVWALTSACSEASGVRQGRRTLPLPDCGGKNKRVNPRTRAPPTVPPAPTDPPVSVACLSFGAMASVALRVSSLMYALSSLNPVWRCGKICSSTMGCVKKRDPPRLGGRGACWGVFRVWGRSARPGWHRGCVRGAQRAIEDPEPRPVPAAGHDFCTHAHIHTHATCTHKHQYTQALSLSLSLTHTHTHTHTQTHKRKHKHT